MKRGRLCSTRWSITSPSIFDRGVLSSLSGSSEESWCPLLDDSYVGSRQPSKAALIIVFLASSPSLLSCPLNWHSAHSDAVFLLLPSNLSFPPGFQSSSGVCSVHSSQCSVFLANLVMAGREIESNAMFHSQQSCFFFFFCVWWCCLKVFLFLKTELCVLFVILL